MYANCIRVAGKASTATRLGDNARGRSRRSQLRALGPPRENEIRRGVFVDPGQGRRLFRDFAEDWRATRVVEATTRATADGCLDLHVIPHFGSMTLATITPMHVRLWIAALIEKGLAPATVHACYVLLSGIMKAAAVEGIVAHSPCRNVTLPRIPRAEQAFLTEEQVEQVAQATPVRYRPMIFVAAYTGLRWGELVGLRATRLDLDRGFLRVEETLIEVNGVISAKPYPKTAAARRQLALPQFLVRELRDHLARLQVPLDGLVFTGQRGRPLGRGYFRKEIWLPAVHAAGLSPPPRFHDLRHTHAAFLIADNAPMLALKERLGHSSVKTSMDRYGHLLPAVDERIVLALDARRRAAVDDGLTMTGGLAEQ